MRSKLAVGNFLRVNDVMSSIDFFQGWFERTILCNYSAVVTNWNQKREERWFFSLETELNNFQLSIYSFDSSVISSHWFLFDFIFSLILLSIVYGIGFIIHPLLLIRSVNTKREYLFLDIAVRQRKTHLFFMPLIEHDLIQSQKKNSMIDEKYKYWNI